MRAFPFLQWFHGGGAARHEGLAGRQRLVEVRKLQRRQVVGLGSPLCHSQTRVGSPIPDGNIQDRPALDPLALGPWNCDDVLAAHPGGGTAPSDVGAVGFGSPRHEDYAAIPARQEPAQGFRGRAADRTNPGIAPVYGAMIPGRLAAGTGRAIGLNRNRQIKRVDEKRRANRVAEGSQVHRTHTGSRTFDNRCANHQQQWDSSQHHNDSS